MRLADVSRRLGESTAQAWGWEELSDDWRAVTRADDVDLVFVLTPNDSHAEISIDALAHGKHVLCEKPLSNTLDGARAMARAAARSGRVHQVGFVYRKWPAVAFARQVIASGGIGEIVHYRGHFFHDYGLDPAMPVTWRLNKAVSGGGSGTDIGSHVIDMARYLVGEIGAVCAASRTHFTRRPLAGRPGETAAVDVDEVTDMLVEFAGGGAGTLADQLARRRPQDGHRLCRARHQGLGRVHVRGADRGAPVQDQRSGAPKAAFARSRSARRTRAPSCSGRCPAWRSGSATASSSRCATCCARLPQGEAATPDFLDGLRAAEVVAAAQASAAERSWQAVERLSLAPE